MQINVELPIAATISAYTRKSLADFRDTVYDWGLPARVDNTQSSYVFGASSEATMISLRLTHSKHQRFLVYTSKLTIIMLARSDPNAIRS